MKPWVCIATVMLGMLCLASTATAADALLSGELRYVPRSAALVTFVDLARIRTAEEHFERVYEPAQLEMTGEDFRVVDPVTLVFEKAGEREIVLDVQGPGPVGRQILLENP